MQFQSLYAMGQELVSIRQRTVDRPDRTCSACQGVGTVELRGAQWECPGCKGAKQIRVTAYGWVVDVPGHVGRIIVEHATPDGWSHWGTCEVEPGVPFTFVHYMLDTTGIGSGAMHKEPDLWPSRLAAQAECDRRNA